jgi:hypothetical protein
VIWLRLLGVLGWLKNALLGMVRAAIRYPWQAALILAIIACVWLYRGKQAALHDLSTANAEIAAIRHASDENRRLAEEQVQRQQAAFDQAAKEAQDEYENTLAAYRGRAGRYAAGHRLSRMPADCRYSATAGQGQDSPGPDGTPVSGDYIAVKPEDFEALIENTARLQAAYDWSQALISEGIAEPAIPDVALSGHAKP